MDAYRVIRRGRWAALAYGAATIALGYVVGGELITFAAWMPLGAFLTWAGVTQLHDARLRERLRAIDDRSPLKWHPRPTIPGSIVLAITGGLVLAVSVSGWVRLLSA